jgi:hypothetical protein
VPRVSSSAANIGLITRALGFDFQRVPTAAYKIAQKMFGTAGETCAIIPRRPFSRPSKRTRKNRHEIRAPICPAASRMLEKTDTEDSCTEFCPPRGKRGDGAHWVPKRAARLSVHHPPMPFTTGLLTIFRKPAFAPSGRPLFFGRYSKGNQLVARSHKPRAAPFERYGAITETRNELNPPRVYCLFKTP